MAAVFARMEFEAIKDLVKYCDNSLALKAAGKLRLLDTADPPSGIQLLDHQKAAALPQINEKPASQHGRVRIIGGKCTQQRTVRCNKCRQPGHWEGECCHKGPEPMIIPFQHETDAYSWAFPFESEEALKSLCGILQLPDASPARLASTHVTYLSSHFQVQRYPSGEAGQQEKKPPPRIGVTMKLPDSVLVGTTASLALSHCEESNITEGILLCSSEDDLDRLLKSILSAAHLAASPTVIPVILYQYFQDALEQKIEDTWQETFKLETDSGQSGILLFRDGKVVTTGNPHMGMQTATEPQPPESQLPPPATASVTPQRQPIPLMSLLSSLKRKRTTTNGTPPMKVAKPPPSREDQAALNQRSIGLAQLALAWENYTQVAVLGISQVDKFLRSLPSADKGTKISPIQEIQAAQLSAVTQKVDFLTQRAACLQTRARYLRGRLELQKNAVSNYLALELGQISKSIAVASWMEGTAMKYLAILGLVFLPAACIAAIFTVPTNLSSQYWTTTATVTALLMGMCVPATLWKNKSAEQFTAGVM
ncbi:hypothetical protein B0H63DRAFT_535171 [Podospora didyma]|uniref:Uncharacterized protein n=1 Tax=Podospora didyma TaxID=330526 RepID=A0AAE0N3C0_9PEZI|nr:hypothetical protein B0H63DRAFT_535171 [Podospora didyma]